MFEMNITEDHKNKAALMANSLGELRNSITYGQGNLAGFIGEILVAEITGANHANTYDYDLVLPNGKTVDVKTKRTGFAPRGFYECSVAAFNTKQKCDYYCFVRVKNDLSMAWILGFYDKAEFFNDAKFHKKGEYDPSNKFTFKADCFNIEINKLRGCP